MKPNSGTSGGFGFIKLEISQEGVIKENNKPIDLECFYEIQEAMRNYIITEYAYQHHEFAAVWPDSECTLRVIMCKNPTENKYASTSWSCAVSYARFGTSINGGASNLSSGGVGVGFDFETGECRDFCIRYKRFTPDGKWMLEKHPETCVIWKKIELPNWSYVKLIFIRLLIMNKLCVAQHFPSQK